MVFGSILRFAEPGSVKHHPTQMTAKALKIDIFMRSFSEAWLLKVSQRGPGSETHPRPESLCESLK